MTDAPPSGRGGAPALPGGLAWLLIATVAICDQVTKRLIEGWLPDLQRYQIQGYEVFSGLLHFHYKRNPGVAFSLFANHPEILTYVTTAAILGIGWYAWRVPRSDRLTRTAFGLILGGALGNLVDRYLRGHVVDFIDFTFPGFLGRWHARLFGTEHFATFNLADTAICLGMGLLILALLLGHRETPHPETDESTEASHPQESSPETSTAH